MDQAKNFAKATVVTAALETTDTVIAVDTGQGLRFPAVPFNATLYNATDYPDPADDPAVEIVRVTDITGDDLTITRAQEGTAAREGLEGKTFFLVAGLTAKTINDLGTAFVFDIDSGFGNIVFTATGFSADASAAITIIGDALRNFNDTRVEVNDDDQQVIITRQPIMPHLPTSNPAIAGALWNDGGTVKVSAG